MAYTKSERDKVFISYSHEDKKWLHRLQVHLKPLSREGKVDWWDDTKISPGLKWREEIEKALDSAKVVVLLVSADFLASDFIAEYELPMALKAAETEGATILSVVVSPSRFSNDKSLSEFQAVNDPSKSLIEMNKGERERCWIKLIDCIKAALASTSKVASVEHIDETVSQSYPQPAIIMDPSLILPDIVPAVGVFIDRNEHIEAIRGFLGDDTRRLVIIQGLPGIGKTTLAGKLAEEVGERFKAVFWMTCRVDQASLDIFFAKLHSFFERNGEQELRGVWNDPHPDQLETKIKKLVRVLSMNSYLLIFDEFQNWMDSDFQLKNSEVRKVLTGILSSAHRSKVMLISDQRLLLDPVIFNLPLGSRMERTLLGLDKPSSIQLLSETGLKIRDEELLNRIINHCDGNPYMMQIFSFLVNGLHRNPEDLLTSGEAETKFTGLLQAATKDLSQESHRALEMLSILRLPLDRDQATTLGLRFDATIGPLLDRFLVTEDILTNKFNVSTIVRNFIKGSLPSSYQREFHERAAKFYMKQRNDNVPRNYEELQLAIEEGFHRFEYGDREGGAHVIISIAPLLVDWGYIELAQQNIIRALNNTLDQSLKAQCLWLIGSIADLRGDFPEALEHFKNALRLFEPTGDYASVAKTLFSIGRIYNALNRFVKADEYFQRCIKTCKEHAVRDGWAASLLGMGWNRQERSFDIDEVLDLYEQSIELAEQSNDIETLSSGHRQIGFLLWEKRRQKDETQRHYDQALQVSEKYQLVKEIGSIHSDLGYLYEEWGDYDKAEQSCRQAIWIFKAIGNNYGLCSAYFNLGKVFESKPDLETAVLWYNQSRSISMSLNNSKCQARACFRLGKVLRKQGKRAEAEAVLLKAARLAKDNNLSKILAAVEEQLQQMNQSPR